MFPPRRPLTLLERKSSPPPATDPHLLCRLPRHCCSSPHSDVGRRLPEFTVRLSSIAIHSSPVWVLRRAPRNDTVLRICLAVSHSAMDMEFEALPAHR